MNLKRTNKIFILFAISLLFCLNGFTQEEPQSMDKMWGESNASYKDLKNGKGKMFDEGNYGMFVHWGLFSKLGGVWKDKTYY